MAEIGTISLIVSEQINMILLNVIIGQFAGTGSKANRRLDPDTPLSSGSATLDDPKKIHV